MLDAPICPETVSSNEATEKTRVLVRQLYDAFARRDRDRLAALIAEDVDWIMFAPVPVFPFGGPRRGRQEALDALKSLARDFELKSHRPETVIVDGESASILSDTVFVQRATGRRLRGYAIDFLRFKDGELIEFRQFMNSFDVIEQVLGREIDV